jgi:uncharacterized protein (TIGR00251 family)
LSERDGSALVAVRVQPRSGRNQIAGERGGRLLVRIAAAPVEGQANRALCKLLAKAAGVARGRVEVVRGGSTRDKLVQIEGIGAKELAGLLPSPDGT